MFGELPEMVVGGANWSVVWRSHVRPLEGGKKSQGGSDHPVAGARQRVARGSPAGGRLWLEVVGGTGENENTFFISKNFEKLKSIPSS